MVLKNFYINMIFFLIICQSSLAHPTVMIWEPEGNNYGHVAVQTKTYHMSLWPDGVVKRDFSSWDSIYGGVPGSLHYHHDYDCYLEGDQEKPRRPLLFPLDNFSDRNLNDAYETVLEYNDVTPDNVALSVGKDKVLEGENPEISLPQTRWRLNSDSISRRGLTKESSYSCCSFVLTLLCLNDDAANEFIYSSTRVHLPSAQYVSIAHVIQQQLTVRKCQRIVEELMQGDHLRQKICLIS